MAEGIEVTTGSPWSVSKDVGRLRVTCARFAPRYAIPSHFHDYACLSVIVEGGFFQAFPGVEYECPPGGLLVKPPGERHVDRWGTRRSRHLIVEPVHFEPGDGGPARRVFEQVSYRLDPRATWLSRRIYEEFERGDDVAALAIEALALELVVLASRTVPDRRRMGDLPDWLRRSRECLADHPAGRVGIGEVARQVGVHPSRLARDFRRYFGVSPSEFVRGLRLARVQSDLERTRDPLSAIALRHGYADQSHLTRELKRATGLTPAAYRRQRGRQE